MKKRLIYELAFLLSIGSLFSQNDPCSMVTDPRLDLQEPERSMLMFGREIDVEISLNELEKNLNITFGIHEPSMTLREFLSEQFQHSLCIEDCIYYDKYGFYWNRIGANQHKVVIFDKEKRDFWVLLCV
jgi:hypothetical protein